MSPERKCLLKMPPLKYLLKENLRDGILREIDTGDVVRACSSPEWFKHTHTNNHTIDTLYTKSTAHYYPLGLRGKG